MYEDFYGLAYDPFRLTPTGRDVFSHPSFKKARAYLEYGLQRGEGFVVITGAPGSGKTTLIRELINELPSDTRHAEIETSRLDADDLLRIVISRFGIRAPQHDKASIIEALRADLLRHTRAGGRTLLLVDEAQDLTPDSLEELRLLTNLVYGGHPLLQIVLMGQPGLRDLIRRPELEQFQQRTVASCRLEPLTEQQSVECLRFRLERAGWRHDPYITTAALKLLHVGAEGVPRRLNLLASRLLLYGFAKERHQLGLADAVAVLEEMDDEAIADWRRRLNSLSHEDDKPIASSYSQSANPAPETADHPADAGDHGRGDTPEAPEAGPAVEPLPVEVADAAPGSETIPEPEPQPPQPTPAEDSARGRAPVGSDIEIPNAAASSDPAASSRHRGRGARRRRNKPRMRSAVVVLSLAMAALGVGLILGAATPVGAAVMEHVQGWLDSVPGSVAGTEATGERERTES